MSVKIFQYVICYVYKTNRIELRACNGWMDVIFGKKCLTVETIDMTCQSAFVILQEIF